MSEKVAQALTREHPSIGAVHWSPPVATLRPSTQLSDDPLEPRGPRGQPIRSQNERERALKRGGGHSVLSIDARDAEGRYLREPVDAMTPERLFDQSWAVNLLEDVLKQLAREYAESARGSQFEILQGLISKEAGQVSYAELAARTGTTVAAVQQAVQRLRKRYKAILHERIAVTLDNPDEATIKDEIRDLFGALAR